ncbi:hypothetical protein LEP1GSC060_3680 [Leptospira weilii serovar Ranarum str. ICFT]|uniref:Uncharacterized protein n=1 Tax=Leptospira weilii serovar Ranarum str. ICFT TaxID=1218598 RepID=N1W7B8_9LEPT|nr:hypothetical protein LEP1GSC060_3680 [Leptospira weilii serovar Ranarum str. ICFT]
MKYEFSNRRRKKFFTAQCKSGQGMIDLAFTDSGKRTGSKSGKIGPFRFHPPRIQSSRLKEIGTR